MMLSSSQLALDALNEKPFGVPIDRESHCAFCGTAIHEGELHSRLEAKDTFVDDTYLAVRSGVICGACSFFSKSDHMNLTAGALFTKNGAFELKTADTIAYFIRNPPEPPFVATIPDSKKQHLLWKASVSFSKSAFFIQFGNHTWRIRHDRLLEAEKILQQIAERLSIEQNRKKPLKPFMVSFETDFKAKTPWHGQLKDLVANEKAEWLIPLRQRLIELDPGEVWALGIILGREGKPYLPLTRKP